MIRTIGIRREVAARVVKRHVCAPSVSAWIIDVDFVGGIGRYAAATHHIHLAIEVQPTRLTGSSRDRRNRTNRVSYWIEAEGIVSVDHRATLVI